MKIAMRYAMDLRQDLALAPRNHQPSAHHHQNHANGRGNFLIVLGGDADVGVAYAHAVVVSLRVGDYERENAKNQNHHSNQK